MSTVDIQKAKTHLSQPADGIAGDRQREANLEFNVKPSVHPESIEIRTVKLGMLKGLYQIPGDIDVDNEVIASEFGAL